ncbi:MAG: hypothetical protein WD823_13870 [Sulfuricaulis sp.]|uniref:hypothetical protein n=1 Tax=Sulfuricaulis sp. TaxID=2003553 RepID=UPI0034A201D3
MTGSESDSELQAIQAVIAALTPLNNDARSRVIDYVFKRLNLSTTPANAVISPTQIVTPVPGDSQSRPALPRYHDIHSFTQAKQPKSANEMAAIVAFYLSELAPTEERKNTINATDIQKYFKQARFRPFPRVHGQTLGNAATAGYLDSASRGEYKLNPVGYNLVAYTLPGKPDVTAGRNKRGDGKKKQKKPARTGAATKKDSKR